MGSTQGSGGCWRPRGLRATLSPAIGDRDGPALLSQRQLLRSPPPGAEWSPPGSRPGRGAPARYGTASVLARAAGPGAVTGGWSGRGCGWGSPASPVRTAGRSDRVGSALPRRDGAPGPGGTPAGKDAAALGGSAANRPPQRDTHRSKPRERPSHSARSVPAPLPPVPGTVRVPAAPTAALRLPRRRGAAPGPARSRLPRPGRPRRLLPHRAPGVHTPTFAVFAAFSPPARSDTALSGSCRNRTRRVGFKLCFFKDF